MHRDENEHFDPKFSKLIREIKHTNEGECIQFIQDAGKCPKTFNLTGLHGSNQMVGDSERAAKGSQNLGWLEKGAKIVYIGELKSPIFNETHNLSAWDLCA